MVGVPVPAPPAGSLVAMTVVTPGGTYSVSFTAGSTYAETAANLNAALRGVGAKVSASTTKTAGVDDGFQLTSDRYGSGTEFTVSGTGADDLGLTGTADDGVDAEVSINGQTYTAAGQTLVKDGLALTVSYTQGQLAALGGSATGTVRVGSGLSGRLERDRRRGQLDRIDLTGEDGALGPDHRDGEPDLPVGRRARLPRSVAAEAVHGDGRRLEQAPGAQLFAQLRLDELNGSLNPAGCCRSVPRTGSSSQI